MNVEDLNQTVLLLKNNQKFIELLVAYRQLKKKKKRLRRWWLKPHLYPQMRSLFGAYENLCVYFALNDHEEFFNFMRISVDDFNYLHELTRARLSKISTRRKPISSEIRLAATLQ